MFVYFWERESASGERQRERETQNLKQVPGSAVSTELDVRLEPTNRETMTWAEVRYWTDWATQAPPPNPKLFLNYSHCNRCTIVSCVVLVCISLMSNDVDYLFICFFAICLSSLMKCLFKCFAPLTHLLNRVVCFLTEFFHLFCFVLFCFEREWVCRSGRGAKGKRES